MIEQIMRCVIKNIIFVTGTDTGVGKTYASCLLLQAMATRGKRTLGIKPIACGGITEQGGNEDAEALQRYSTVKLAYRDINPFLFSDPIAPHIAAHRAQQTLSAKILADALQTALSTDADFIVIEGAGGYLVPFNDTETWADFVVHLDIPVLLVVGMKLGCLNHSLLTQSAIAHGGGHLSAWIANHIQPDMQVCQDNIKSLQQRLSAPLLASIDYQGSQLKGFTEWDFLN